MRSLSVINTKHCQLVVGIARSKSWSNSQGLLPNNLCLFQDDLRMDLLKGVLDCKRRGPLIFTLWVIFCFVWSSLLFYSHKSWSSCSRQYYLSYLSRLVEFYSIPLCLCVKWSGCAFLMLLFVWTRSISMSLTTGCYHFFAHTFK